MGRLVQWPSCLIPITSEPLSGPHTIGASSNTSIGNFNQTVASPFALWRWAFSFKKMRGREFRAYRGFITALHGGANATRFRFRDPDKMTFQEAGVVTTSAEIQSGVTWSNGESWSNGANWAVSRPKVSVPAVALKDATQVSLAGDFWGHSLQVGDYIGFTPFHFGLYVVTEVISTGTYRIWPPLRKALSTTDYATLDPVIALRLEGEASANSGRGVFQAEGLTATFVEVLDADVRAYFS